MADDINISYSFSLDGVATTPQVPPEPVVPQVSEPLYALMDVQPLNLGQNRALLVHSHSDAQLLVGMQVATALHTLAPFQTLEDHVERLTQTVPELEGQHDDVRRVLGMLLDAGLLTSADTVCKRLTHSGDATRRAPTRVFVMTCDRPAAIERLLQSMLMAGNLNRHEELVLVDDSRDEGNAAVNRELVRQFNRTSPRDMRYLGAAEQDKLVQGLRQALPEHSDALDFLLDRQRWAGFKTYGRTRTLCLLMSMGRRAIVIDDDTVCAAVASPYRDEGVAFKSARQSDFYASEPDMLERTHKEDFDPLTGHARCLGLTLGEALVELGVENLQPADLEGSNSAFISQWAADSRLLVTQTGSVGDPGSPGPNWIFTVDPVSAERLLNSSLGFEAAMQSRHFWMGQTRPTFGKMAYMSQMTGLDNTQFLPPYFPVFRGEDSLFGAMVEHLHPSSAVLEYDWAVPHLPLDVDERRKEEPAHSGRGYFSMEKYVTDRTLYESGVSLQTRLERLVLLLRELSETSDDGLMTLFRNEVVEFQRSQEDILSRKLHESLPRPARWQQYLEERFSNIINAMGEQARLADIPGMPEGVSDREILDTFRQYIGEYTTALAAWPAIRAAAEQLADELLQSGELAP